MLDYSYIERVLHLVGQANHIEGISLISRYLYRKFQFLWADETFETSFILLSNHLLIK